MTQEAVLEYVKGTVLMLERGEYSDFGIEAGVVTLQVFRPRVELAEWRERLGKDADGDWIADDWEHGPSAFVADLIARQVLAPLEYQSLHIGSYGSVEI